MPRELSGVHRELSGVHRALHHPIPHLRPCWLPIGAAVPEIPLLISGPVQASQHALMLAPGMSPGPKVSSVLALATKWRRWRGGGEGIVY